MTIKVCAKSITAAGAMLLVAITAADAAGALAVGKCGVAGPAFNQPTVEAARKSALAVCATAGAVCTVRATVRKGCYSLYIDRAEPCNEARHAVAVAGTPEEAANTALAKCIEAGGTQCFAQLITCDTRG